MAELKPCPFCGGKVYMHYDPLRFVFCVAHCYAKPPLRPCTFDCKIKAKTRVRAEKIWNRRAE